MITIMEEDGSKGKRERKRVGGKGRGEGKGEGERDKREQELMENCQKREREKGNHTMR
jgi:hypothetical protein